MKQTRLWLFICLAAVFLSGSLVVQAKSLTIGMASGNTAATIPITLSSDEPVEGFSLAVQTGNDSLRITDIICAVDAEFIQPNFPDDTSAVLGVVMDYTSPWDDTPPIPVGDTVIAELGVAPATALACGESETVAIELKDGLDTPPISNTIVVEGTSITKLENLELNNGSYRIEGACSPITIVDASGPSGDEVVMDIIIDNGQPIEGYVLSVLNPTDIVLEKISTDGTHAGAVGVEFEVAKTYPNGGTLGAVFDYEEPWNNPDGSPQVLNPGTGQTIAKLTYTTTPFFETDALSKTFPVEFVDGVFGSPLLSNTIVSAGMSLTPTKNNGEITFTGMPVSPIDFYADCSTAAAGGEAKVVLSYTSGRDPLQGISMSISYPAELTILDVDGVGEGQGIVADRNLEGTMTEALGAEYVSFNAADGELVVGILVDATPPIPINHMYPMTEEQYPVLNVFFKIPDVVDPPEKVYEIKFVNGLTGAGDVETDNVASVFNESKCATTHDGCIEISGSSLFLRADCNGDGKVDIADPAATMAYLFLSLYEPKCMDACDADDSSMVDLADVLHTLNFLFKQGADIPAPYPNIGTDPTQDMYNGYEIELGCEEGVAGAGNSCP